MPRLSTVRTVLALVATNDLEVQQMDVKTAFLHGKLEENIYMRQPEGFEVSNSKFVCKIEKSIYGLKQSFRTWYRTFAKTIGKINFKCCEYDNCTFINQNKTNLILCLYVDDILLVGQKRDVEEIKIYLNKNFDMKDLGDLSMFIGLQIERDRIKKGISVSQSDYAKKILNRFHMGNAKPIETPLAFEGSSNTMKGYQPANKMLYQQAVGSLMYIMIGSRPDLAHAVGILSQSCSNPTEDNWQEVKRCLRFSKGTTELKLVYQNSMQIMQGYCDADWGGKIGSRSTSGYVFVLGSGAISWSSKRQATTALSTTEAEYISIFSASQEAVWLKRMLKKNLQKEIGPITLWNDNQGAITYIKNGGYSPRMKHIRIKQGYIRELIEDKLMDIKHKPTADMIADPLTKQINKNQFKKLCYNMGLQSNINIHNEHL